MKTAIVKIAAKNAYYKKLFSTHKSTGGVCCAGNILRQR
jgi:hypothetical protein